MVERRLAIYCLHSALKGTVYESLADRVVDSHVDLVNDLSTLLAGRFVLWQVLELLGQLRQATQLPLLILGTELSYDLLAILRRGELLGCSRFHVGQQGYLSVTVSIPRIGRIYSVAGRRCRGCPPCLKVDGMDSYGLWADTCYVAIVTISWPQRLAKRISAIRCKRRGLGPQVCITPAHS
jgi:hypothetical protein